MNKQYYLKIIMLHNYLSGFFYRKGVRPFARIRGRGPREEFVNPLYDVQQGF